MGSGGGEGGDGETGGGDTKKKGERGPPKEAVLIDQGEEAYRKGDRQKGHHTQPKKKDTHQKQNCLLSTTHNRGGVTGVIPLHPSRCPVVEKQGKTSTWRVGSLKWRAIQERSATRSSRITAATGFPSACWSREKRRQIGEGRKYITSGEGAFVFVYHISVC